MLSVVGDILVDSETSVVTSSISRCAGIIFGGAHRSRVCVRVFIEGECVCASGVEPFLPLLED